jgi:nicotinate-nucleotide pyrophosphorylase (carboxylating)
MDRTELLLWLAIQEDIGNGDVTTEAVVDPGVTGKAFVFGRESLVLSGSQPFRKVFNLVDPALEITSFFQDGERIEANTHAFMLEGCLQSLLTGERTALNLLQRLSGIATLTRQMVDAMAGASCRLLDTRKTTPLWRALEKEAVRHGGGRNHRFGLYDGVLIKDNHITAVGGVGEAVQRARQRVSHTLKVEVEVENLQELQEAIAAGADVVLLDNFSPEDLKTAVAVTAGRCLLEASGGVTLDRIRAIAESGVDFVSCGALTHSARAIDISMEFVPG